MPAVSWRSIAFLDTGSLTTQIAKVIKLCTADLTATQNVNVVDHRRVQRKIRSTPTPKLTLRTVTVSDAAVFDRNTDALERLETFLVAFLDADVYAGVSPGWNTGMFSLNCAFSIRSVYSF